MTQKECSEKKKREDGKDKASKRVRRLRKGLC